MASLNLKDGKQWYCQFIHNQKRYTAALGPISKTDAFRWKVRAEELLSSLKRGLRDLPPGVSITDFLMFDGRPPVDPEFQTRKDTTLAELKEQYLTTVGNGSLESNTVYTSRIHLSHLEATLGKRFLLSGLSLRKLQSHIDRRQATVSPITIAKEVASFRAAWNWALRSKLVTGTFPSAGLAYAKTDEKPAFQTMEQIQRKIKAGGDPDQLWECLYLDAKQIEDLLKYVHKKKAPAWVFPMLATAAYTGMRRSELIRAKPEDIDLKTSVITIREKKRQRGTRTTRTCPISKSLATVLKDWLATRDGAAYLFGYENRQLSVQASQKAIVRILAKSKWSMCAKWHLFRHSFISACAAKGIDQRMLQEWCGHQTAEMSRRYTHLLPSTQSDAIARVFG